MQAIKILHYQSLTSTMITAREYKSTDPILILADQQTKARGTKGRSWFPAQVGFYGTYKFIINKNSDLSGLSLAIGLQLLKLLLTIAPAKELKLKWPNDIVLSMEQAGQYKKLAGILIECIHSTHAAVLIGIGINLVKAPSNQNAVALADLTDRSLSALELAQIFNPILLKFMADFEVHGFKHYKDEWRKYALQIGQEIFVESANISGIFHDLDDCGAMLLSPIKSPNQLIKIYNT